MLFADLGEIRVHYRLDGPDDGPALVFANALGTDFRIWDGVLAHLPPGLRILRYDMRGHGLTTAPIGPYFMGDLVAMSKTRTRMNFALDTRPKTVPARLMIQSLKLARHSMLKRFRKRIADFASDLEARAQNRSG